VTCTVVGVSSYELSTIDGVRYSTMEGVARLEDADEYCRVALVVVQVDLVWYRSNISENPLGHESSSSFGPSVRSSVTVSQVPRVVVAGHSILFDCDEIADGCSFDFTTSPK
jgi:hypothetical protein